MILDATATAAALRAGDLDPATVRADALARIASADAELHAIAALDPSGLRRDGPFAGVPFLTKDLLPIAGRPVSFGARALRGWVAPQSSPYADALVASGVDLLGRTRSSELGLLGSTEALLYGPPARNPWDRARSPTGSSGGAAVAVAAGMVPFAHASDGGGSIRIPASACGLFGFKPGAGRCVSAALMPAPVDLVIEHVLTRSVRDSAAWLAHTEDPSHPSPVGLVSRPLERPLKIGLYRHTLFGEAPCAVVDRALDRAAGLLTALGHAVVEVEGPPVDAAAISDAFFLLAGAGAAQLAGQLGPAAAEGLEPFTRALAERFLARGPGALGPALAAIHGAAAAYHGWAAGFDVSVCPTIPDLPPPTGTLSPVLDPDLLLRRTERLAGYTPVHNMAGVPAMSVPIGMSEDGLPIGIHFAGQAGADGLLLALALQLEQAAPWADRWPRVAG